MILASAGTGKTYSLASRAVRLLFTDQELDSILATTFTRKAAGEILHRVLSWLADAVEDPSGFDRLALVLHPLEITRDTVRYQLGRLCSHLHRFRVSTLDSFYSQLARSFALELKLPPGWTLSDTFQSEQIQHEAVSRMFDTMDRSALRSLVSQLSKGDASRSIRREIENVVASGYELFRKTTEEAWNQLHVPTGPKPEQVDAALATFQSSHVEHKNYPGARDKLIEKFQACQWTDFLGQTLVRNCDKEVPKYYSKELPTQAVKALEILAKKAAVEELASRRAQNEAAFRLLQNYHTQLEWVKSRNRIVTFDDIAERLSHWMQETVGKFRNKDDQPQEGPAPTEPDSTDLKSIAYRLDCPVNHLLLDEFQDTSPMQWDIIKPFAEAIVQGSAKTNSFFCVGDSKQAIYSWRGGVSEIFESVGKQIDRVRQEKLVKSFRSSPVP
jgi:ATP-dependent exoDNAse (exonuclease V) beta subunit